MQTEYAQYQHHYSMLAANNKTLNRYEYNGHIIQEKLAGFYVDGFHRCKSLQAAKECINHLQEDSIAEAMEQFRKAFPYTRVTVFANCMVYRTVHGKCDEVAREAGTLIKTLNLPLCAIPTTFRTQDSFIIQKQVSYATAIED